MYSYQKFGKGAESLFIIHFEGDGVAGEVCRHKVYANSSKKNQEKSYQEDKPY